jgi:hypothetical protein
MPALQRSLQQVAASQVYVGIPQKTASRPGEPINNAELMYVLTNGSPLQGIPATPIIEPAIELPENRIMIGAALGQAAKDIIGGNAIAAEDDLNKAGTIGSNAVKRYFTDPRNGWPPNAPSTIARKGSDRRNIDKGELRRAVTHVLNPE